MQECLNPTCCPPQHAASCGGKQAGLRACEALKEERSHLPLRGQRRHCVMIRAPASRLTHRPILAPLGYLFTDQHNHEVDPLMYYAD